MPYPRGTQILMATRGGGLARRGMRAASYHPYARTASRAITAYRYGKAAYPYVKGAVNFYRKRRASRVNINRAKKRRTMRRVGENIGVSSAKYAELEVPTLTPMNPQTLYQTQLLNITRQPGLASGSVLNRRMKDIINMRGIKFCLNFRCESPLGNAKAWMNVAIISPKAGLDGEASIPPDEFFRSPNGNTRDEDFNGLSMSNIDYRCCGINTDRYNVHKRQVMTLGPNSSTEGFKERYLEFYFPIKRQVRYEPGSNFPSGKNMYLVWWFSTSDGGLSASSIRYQYTIRRYFRDTP